MAIAFYCLSTLDLAGYTKQKISPTDRENWLEWIWAHYVGMAQQHNPPAQLLNVTSTNLQEADFAQARRRSALIIR